MIIDYTNKTYRRLWAPSGGNPEEISKSREFNRIAEGLDTDRVMVTVNAKHEATDKAIIFVNGRRDYDWLEDYKGLIVVTDEDGEDYKRFGVIVSLKDLKTQKAKIKAVQEAIDEADGLHEDKTGTDAEM